MLIEGDSAPFDYVAPLFSLPRLLGISAHNIPIKCSYISVPTDVNHDALTLNLSTELIVGLAWAGNPAHRNDKNRSINLKQLISLLEAKSARLFSFQKPIQKTDQKLLQQYEVTDLSTHLSDYSDTAAFMNQMDLIITVDTSVAHLAGALGKEVWTLLPYAPDWRWMLGRIDSPWYPTMRLFRQPKPGDWQAVIEDVYKELVTRRPNPPCS